MRGYFSIAQLIRLRRIWLGQNMDIVEIYLRSERVALREWKGETKRKGTIKKKNDPIKFSVHSIKHIYIYIYWSTGVWFAINWHLHLARNCARKHVYSAVYVYIHTGTPPMKSRAITLISPRYCNLLLKMILCYKIDHTTQLLSYILSFVLCSFLFTSLWNRYTLVWCAHTHKSSYLFTP